MSTKTFSYVENGLSYTVTVYEQDGKFFADITVDEGAMDVNAIYFGDADFTGDSESLKGSLNMNGAGSELDGEAVQWDNAETLSKPGLGKEGTDKETYLAEGDTLKVELDIESLDEIAVFGIRATSTTTEAGSIKGVSEEDPEAPEEPEEPGDEPTYDKVFFGDFNADGGPSDGWHLLAEGDESDLRVLPEGQEPTFANYLAYYETLVEDDMAMPLNQIDGVAFYQFDAEGNPQEAFRIEADEDGFADADELLAAYDAALDTMEAEGTSFEGMDLIAALRLPDEDDDGGDAAVDEELDDAEVA